MSSIENVPFLKNLSKHTELTWVNQFPSVPDVEDDAIVTNEIFLTQVNSSIWYLRWNNNKTLGPPAFDVPSSYVSKYKRVDIVPFKFLRRHSQRSNVGLNMWIRMLVTDYSEYSSMTFEGNSLENEPSLRRLLYPPGFPAPLPAPTLALSCFLSLALFPSCSSGGARSMYGR